MVLIFLIAAMKTCLIITRVFRIFGGSTLNVAGLNTTSPGHASQDHKPQRQAPRLENYHGIALRPEDRGRKLAKIGLFSMSSTLSLSLSLVNLRINNNNFQQCGLTIVAMNEAEYSERIRMLITKDNDIESVLIIPLK
jgi:hypothetical protein